MKIQYASDLHLELSRNSRWLKNNPLNVTGNILVLAEDIDYLGTTVRIIHFGVGVQTITNRRLLFLETTSIMADLILRTPSQNGPMNFAVMSAI